MESNANVPIPNDKLPRPQTTHPVLLFFMAVLAAAVIGTFLWVKFFRYQVTDDVAANLVAAGFDNTVTHKLDPTFKDVDGDLVADPPAAVHCIDPATLIFCYVASDQAEDYKKQWKPFADYLSKVTGKPVEYSMVTSTHDELKAMHDGQLQVAAFNTGSVPAAVNRSGFVPVCAVPTADGGAVTHTDVIVPADSDIQKPEDLKGHELTLTDPDSNSGYKAPLVLLRANFGLQPMSDIRLRYSHSHDASIAGVVGHRYEAAAVADDMLSRELASGTVTPAQFRTIYKSESFPTAGLGYVYNLNPELAQKVRDALLHFDWKGTPLEKVLSTNSQTKFVPVNYKNDFSLIRRIDDEMGSLTGF